MQDRKGQVGLYFVTAPTFSEEGLFMWFSFSPPSLGPLVSKVKEYQVETIVDTLCTNMLSDKEQLRDISSIGLKTVISELPPPSTGKSLLTLCSDNERLSLPLQSVCIQWDESACQPPNVIGKLCWVELVLWDLFSKCC